MNKSDIKKYYKVFGYINLIFSFLLVIFIRDTDLGERIFALIAINVGYHMLYWFFSSLSKDPTRLNNNFNKIVGTGMLKLFSIFGIICSFGIIYFFISNAILQKEYIGLFGICIAMGLFLGAYSLWTDLRNE
ncbi:hypothetical protein [Aquimarina litoralis]|uniref:hypothetical protein n=1 Tax=Aquimarina litoralis TaxID=584605 RepID=UPI001C57B898|nr:hypothetical protein [Aquimarina litoralis]MBW1296342.1 hypothetical protein [Aquimarina litoralis]